jgi:hypothetical protein
MFVFGHSLHADVAGRVILIEGENQLLVALGDFLEVLNIPDHT